MLPMPVMPGTKSRFHGYKMEVPIFKALRAKPQSAIRRALQENRIEVKQIRRTEVDSS
jgi:hypothetical protein